MISLVLLWCVFSFVSQTGFFNIDFAIVTKFLARRLDNIIIGTRIRITTNLLTVTTIL